jgi:diphosphomevalonate decarboxylase
MQTRKATAVAHPNIALIKYWGNRDDALRLPANSSLSMNLAALTTTTTVEFCSDLDADSVTIDDTDDLMTYTHPITLLYAIAAVS